MAFPHNDPMAQHRSRGPNTRGPFWVPSVSVTVFHSPAQCPQCPQYRVLSVPSTVSPMTPIQSPQCSQHSLPNIPSTESTVSPVQGLQHPQYRGTILGPLHGPQGLQCTLWWSQHAATILGPQMAVTVCVLQSGRGSVWQVPTSMACPQCHTVPVWSHCHGSPAKGPHCPGTVSPVSPLQGPHYHQPRTFMDDEYAVHAGSPHSRESGPSGPAQCPQHLQPSLPLTPAQCPQRPQHHVANIPQPRVPSVPSAVSSRPHYRVHTGPQGPHWKVSGPSQAPQNTQTGCSPPERGTSEV